MAYASNVLQIAAAAILLSPNWTDRCVFAAERPLGDNITLTFPSDDRVPILEQLGSLIESILSARQPLENYLLKGEISYVTRSWSGREANQQLPDPKWKPFVAVSRGGKRRFEQEYEEASSAGTRSYTVYRLLDGSSLYKLDSKYLAIMDLKSVDFRWRDMTMGLSTFELIPVVWGGGSQTLLELLQGYVDRIENDSPTAGYFSHRRRRLHIHMSPTEITIEDLSADPSIAPDSTLKVTIDLSAGFNIKHAVRQIGEERGSFFTKDETTCHYREVAPDVYVLDNAEQSYAVLGTEPQKDGGAGWGRFNARVTEAQFGDFDYPEAKFAMTSLPIEKGTFISDRRTDPPKEYQYGDSPVSDDVLGATRDDPQLRHSRWMTLLILNVIIAIAVAGAWAVHRKRGLRG